jgi:hypothetical protein
MKHSPFLRAALAFALVGVLAGCSAGNRSAGTSTTGAATEEAHVAATFSAADLEAIASAVNDELALGGTVLNDAATKAQADAAGGLDALTDRLGGDLDLQPAECAQLTKDVLAKAPRDASDVTAVLVYGTSVLVLSAPDGKAVPAAFRDTFTSTFDEVLAKCGEMTVSSGDIAVTVALEKADVTTDAELTYGYRQSMTLDGAASLGTSTVVQARDGNLLVVVTESGDGTVAPADVVNAVLAAAR